MFGFSAAAIGTAIAEGAAVAAELAATAGTAIASGAGAAAGAVGSGLGAAGSAIGSGLGAAGSAIGSGITAAGTAASELGAGLASGVGLGGEAAAVGGEAAAVGGEAAAGGASSSLAAAPGISSSALGSAIPTASATGLGSPLIGSANMGLAGLEGGTGLTAGTSSGIASVPGISSSALGSVVPEASATALPGTMGGTQAAAAPSLLSQGIDLVAAHPGAAMQVAGLGLGMLGSPQQQAQKQQLESTNVPDYTSANFQRYQATPNYAEGGAVQAPQSAMNPIVAKAMAAQQAQMQQQAPQPAPMQPTPQVAPQPTPQQGIAQPQQPVGMASGGITDGYNLGGYAHGGIPRLLSGVGDGVDDQIPATIGADGKQPARLADGEYVISARIVSELGNGSTEAGAKRLKAMTDRIQARRSKSIGKGKVAVDSKAVKDLPA